MDELCEANGTFAINLLKMLGEKDNSQNVFVSPLSISATLALVSMGARGDTATQMSQVCMPVAEGERQTTAYCAFTELIFLIPHTS